MKVKINCVVIVGQIDALAHSLPRVARLVNSSSGWRRGVGQDRKSERRRKCGRCALITCPVAATEKHAAAATGRQTDGRTDDDCAATMPPPTGRRQPTALEETQKEITAEDQQAGRLRAISDRHPLLRERIVAAGRIP